MFPASLKTVAWLILLQDIPYAVDLGVKKLSVLLLFIIE